MATTLRIGDQSHEVRLLQKLLNERLNLMPALKVDGDFGSKTEEAVEQFQTQQKLYADGVCGRDTWKAFVDTIPAKSVQKHAYRSVALDKYKEGYNRATLLEPTAVKVEKIREYLNSVGAILTSSGGLRALNAPVSASRSATSFHYSGRALDLFVYSGMVDPHTDPFVVVEDGATSRFWRVYARAKEGYGVPELTLNGYVYGHKVVKTTGHFVDLSQLFADHGMHRIRARKSFFRPGGARGGAEWWHFQDEEGLIEGETFFGESLLSMYGKNHTLLNSKPWENRDKVFGVDWG